MAKLSKFAFNTDMANEGTWVDFGDGLKLKIARAGNKAYEKAMESHPKLKAAIASKGRIKLGDDVWLEAIRECQAKHILVDWEGLEDDNDKPITYSFEESLKIFTDKGFDGLRKTIEDIANSDEAFREQEITNISKP